MARFCRVCGDIRPNEKFGGRGHRSVVCSECRRLPKEVQRRELLMREIHGFLDQSNISKKNIKRLTKLESDDDECVASLAGVLKQIAVVSPGRRKRWRRLRERHRHLIHAARQTGLVDWDIFDLDSVEADDGWPSEFDDLEDDFAPENCFGVWIEPRPHEREPRCTE